MRLCVDLRAATLDALRGEVHLSLSQAEPRTWSAVVELVPGGVWWSSWEVISAAGADVPIQAALADLFEGLEL